MDRDSTQEWLLPAGSRPALLPELEARIDTALAIAHASAQAVEEVGAVAVDAARQARRAAELAQRASEAIAFRPAPAAAASGPAAGGVGRAVEPDSAPLRVEPPPDPHRVRAEHPQTRPDARLRTFNERADLVMKRLRALQRDPHRDRRTSGLAGERR